MIHLEAVYHRASQQFCYALNEEILMVGLQTGEEVEQVWIHYGDPFSTGILGGNEAWEGSREEIVTKMRLPQHLWWEIPDLRYDIPRALPSPDRFLCCRCKSAPEKSDTRPSPVPTLVSR